MNNQTLAPDAACPCGDGRRYGECCQPYHLGASAPTPAALMRSRYTAYVLKLTEYLLATWHVTSRPSSLDLRDDLLWVSLTLLSESAVGDSGRVHFRAIHRAGDGWGFLEEESRFVREQGRWFYVDGEVRISRQSATGSTGIRPPPGARRRRP